MKVTIVGTGSVGAALARNCVRHGVQVQLAGRDLEKTRQLASSLGATAVGMRAIEDGVVFLAVPADTASGALEEARLMPGSIVVDCSNPIKWDAGPVHTPPAEGSMAVHLAKRFPILDVLKAFNTFGAEFHENPQLGSTSADLYFAGDSAEAKKTFGELARKLGFEPVDVGPLRNAAHLESLAVLWIHLATVGGRGRDSAFKLLKR